MPQGLPKKIEISRLLAHFALQLGDPLPRQRSLIEQASLRPAPGFNLLLARPAPAAQRRQPAQAVPVMPVVPQLPRHISWAFPALQTTDRQPLQLLRIVPRSLHQSLSSPEKLSVFSLSHLGGALQSFIGMLARKSKIYFPREAAVAGTWETRTGGCPSPVYFPVV